MSAVKEIMSLRGSVGTATVVEALGEAGGDEAVKAIMSLRGSVGTSVVVQALGRAGRAKK